MDGERGWCGKLVAQRQLAWFDHDYGADAYGYVLGCTNKHSNTALE
jgi:hypothetical protein